MDDRKQPNHDPQNSQKQTQARQQARHPLSPQECLKLHPARMSEDYTDAAVSSHESRLKFFIEFCDERDIQNLNNLKGRDIL